MKKNKQRKSNIDELKRRITHSKDHQTKLIKHLDELKDKFIHRELSYHEYEGHIKQKHNNKTIPQWIEHHDRFINTCEKEIRKFRRQIVKNEMVIILSIFIISLIFLVAFYTLPLEKPIPIDKKPLLAPELSIDIPIMLGNEDGYITDNSNCIDDQRGIYSGYSVNSIYAGYLAQGGTGSFGTASTFRSFLNFDVGSSGIPTGSTFTKAELLLYRNDADSTNHPIRTIEVLELPPNTDCSSLGLFNTIGSANPLYVTTNYWSSGEGYGTNIIDLTDEVGSTILTYLEEQVDTNGHVSIALKMDIEAGGPGGEEFVAWRSSENGLSFRPILRVFYMEDETAPVVDISLPIEGSFLDDPNFNLEFTAIDTNLDLNLCTFAFDPPDPEKFGFPNCNSPIVLAGFEGENNLVICAGDTFGNEGCDSVTFTIDTVNPSVIITAPPNPTTSNNANLPVVYTATDALPHPTPITCSYTDNGEVPISIPCGTSQTIIGPWSEGSHNIVITATDSAGNVDFDTVTFTIDLDFPPSIFNISKINNVLLKPGVPGSSITTAISGFTTTAPTTTAPDDGNGQAGAGLTFLIEVSDLDGVDNLPNTFADELIRVTLTDFDASEATPRTSENTPGGSCLKIISLNGFDNDQASGNHANYSCQINMYWYDEPGFVGTNPWDILVEINDLDGIPGTEDYRDGIIDKFTVLENKGFVVTANDLTTSLEFGSLDPGEVNKEATNNPLILTNVGNEDIPNIGVLANHLIGVSDGSKQIDSEEFRVGIDQGLVCTAGDQMSNAIPVEITDSTLPRGDFINDLSLVENLYVCLVIVDPKLPVQSYSATGTNAWDVEIFVVGLLIRRRRKLKKDELVMALISLKNELINDYSKDKEKLIELLTQKIKNKYRINRTELQKEITKKEIKIPITIFSKKIGMLESLTKYLKENLNMNYKEISILINRNERTIWTAYKKATEKQKITKIKKTNTYLPIKIFNNKKLTILESVVLHLKDKNLKNKEIATLIDRDQRNVWNIYSTSMKKIKRKI